MLLMNREYVNYLKKVFTKAILHFFWLFPLNEKKITLLNELSYTFGDSLKYFDIYLHNLSKKEYKIVFPIKDGAPPSVYSDDVIVVPGSFKYFKEIITSGIIITNAGGVSYLPKRKKQRIISTWHGGGPYKKTSTDVYDNYWYKKQAEMNANNTDFILSSCEYFSAFEAKSMGYKPEEIIRAGLPRNDILFIDHDSIKKKVRKYYAIPDNTKFILFAPTFRSKENEFSDLGAVKNYIELDPGMLISTLEERYHCKWVCGIRLHPKLANIDMSKLNVINCTSYPDMQELICCADVVISDYSSLIWDYSFTYRPIFLYAPDIKQYEEERGFYMPSSDWPYPIAHNNEEMRKIILEYDENKYIQRVKEHHKASGSFENGNACEILLKLIEQH